MNQIKSSIKVLAIILVMMVIANKVQSQVSIGVPVPSGSAMLDVSSTTKGFLPPRMSEIQRVLILRPDAGLIVYQTDGKKGLYYYDGSSWTYVMSQLNTLTPDETPIAIGGRVSEHITTFGTVVSAPTFITSEWSNVGGFAGRLRTPRLVYGNNFDGTANLTSGLISDGITSSTTLAVGTNATITGTLAVGGVTTINNNATITGTLNVSNIQGSNQLNLKPQANDSRYLKIYNTSPQDIHIDANSSGGLIYFGNDDTYFTVNTAGGKTIGIKADNGLTLAANSTTLSGTLTLPSLSTSSLLVTNGSKTVVSGSLTGDITTSGLTTTLTNTGVISGTYGSSTAVPQITVDAKGRITTITVTNTQIPDASAIVKGLVNTSTQTFAGNKTISGTLAVSGNATVTGTLLVSTVSSTSTPAVLELSSTTQGFLPPRLTTAQRDLITAPVAGLTIWNTTNKQLEVYEGSYWVNMNGKLVSTINVGDSYGGGIVAYIFVPGDIGYVAGQTHGLIAASADQTTDAGVKWFPSAFYDVTQTFLGLGLANTISIIKASGTASLTSYAAGLVNSYRGGGYSDWYLPSKDELNKLYTNRSKIGGFATSGIQAYWSSSQSGTFNFSNFTEYVKGITNAWVQLFYTSGIDLEGIQKELGISNARRVRAVRVF